jgi:hypothetical protein
MVLSFFQYLHCSRATTTFSHGIFICLSCYCWSVVSKSDDVQVSLNSVLRSRLLVNRSTWFEIWLLSSVGGCYSLCQKYCSATRYPQSFTPFFNRPHAAIQFSGAESLRSWSPDGYVSCVFVYYSHVTGRYPEPVKSKFYFSLFVTVHRRPGWRHPFFFFR